MASGSFPLHVSSVSPFGHFPLPSSVSPLVESAAGRSLRDATRRRETVDGGWRWSARQRDREWPLLSPSSTPFATHLLTPSPRFTTFSLASVVRHFVSHSVHSVVSPSGRPSLVHRPPARRSSPFGHRRSGRVTLLRSPTGGSLRSPPACLRRVGEQREPESRRHGVGKWRAWRWTTEANR